MNKGLAFFLPLLMALPLHAGFRVVTDDASGTVVIEDAGRAVATYAYRDPTVKRPYFANVKAPNGIQVTRNWPPIKGEDAMDHATLHPGIWMAFGRLNGGDFWRSKDWIRHSRFIEEPITTASSVRFVVENEYIHEGQVICVESAEHEILRRPEGYLLLFDSRYMGVGRLDFGDHQEMGLGIRLATPLTVQGGSGRILNSEGQLNESETWGQPAQWTDYSGLVGQRRTGAMLMPDPRNFRQSRFHSRDYGFTAANPFAQKDFNRGDALRTRTAEGMRLHMQFGVLVYSRADTAPLDHEAAYDDFLKAIKLPPKPSGPVWKRHTIDASSRGADGTRVGDLNRDGLPDLTTGWEQGGEIHVCINPGPQLSQNPWPTVVVGKVKGPEDAVFADLDGDGGLDVVSSTEGDEQTAFAHFSPDSTNSLLNSEAWTTGAFPITKGLTRWMFCLPMQIDGQRGTDLVFGSKNPNGSIGWLQSPENPRDLNDWKWTKWVDAGWIMSLREIDMDGDGDSDVLYTDRSGREAGIWWLENPGPRTTGNRAWQKRFVAGSHREMMFLDVGDLDGDSLEDVVAAVRDDDIVVARRLKAGAPKWERYSIPFPPGTGTGKAVALGDLNKDGTTDIVVTCEKADQAVGVFWLQKQHDSWAVHDISGLEKGIKFDRIELIDLDQDGDLDVITCEERDNLGVIWYENPQKQ